MEARTVATHWPYVHARTIERISNVPPSISSQPAAGVGSIHAEADGAVPNFGERSDGAAGEKTL